jgi:1,4-alpha-glucan branching enzyme
MNNFITILLVVVLFVFGACNQKAKEESTKFQSEQSKPGNWYDDAVIYEVNIRQYTPEGTFNAFREHLPRLKELGVELLWIMPIQPISVKNRKGTL